MAVVMETVLGDARRALLVSFLPLAPAPPKRSKVRARDLAWSTTGHGELLPQAQATGLQLQRLHGRRKVQALVRHPRQLRQVAADELALGVKLLRSASRG